MTQWWSPEELATEQARYSGHELWLAKSGGVVHDTFDAERCCAGAMSSEELAQFMRDHDIDQTSVERLMRVHDIIERARSVFPDAWVEPLTEDRAGARRRSMLIAAAEIGM